MPVVHRQVFYAGRVQGVGFRYTVRQLAAGYDVTGWVRNLSDGRVELLASGEPAEVSAFLEGIMESELGAYVRNAETHEVATPPSGGADARGHSGFFIRH